MSAFTLMGWGGKRTLNCVSTCILDSGGVGRTNAIFCNPVYPTFLSHFLEEMSTTSEPHAQVLLLLLLMPQRKGLVEAWNPPRLPL